MNRNIKRVLLENEAKTILKQRGLSVPEGIFIPKNKALADYEEALSKLSYPLVAKVSSSEIRSKTEIKGVILDIMNKDELRNAIDKLLDIKGAEGVLIEEMQPQGIEVIIGGIIDEQFGPILMFGLGGIFVELFEDVAFALAPIKKDQALWLIRQVKGYRLLEGYRGKPPVDIDSLIDILLTISEMIETGQIREIDLNPVVLYPLGYEKKAIILDAKIEFI
jgi:succinyl-CoA synthetase beta subunit